MLDWPWMLWVKLPVVDKIHLKTNKLVVAEKSKARGDLKVNNSPYYLSQLIRAQ